MRHVKDLARRSKWLVVVVTIAKDLRAGWAARRGVPSSTGGATHRSFSLDQSLAYIDSVFDDYRRYGELDAELRGQRVLELGPGDNYGVALRFLGHGAKQVVCVDKFEPPREERQQRRIYEAILDRLDEPARSSIGDAVRLNPVVKFDPERIRPIEGVAIEEIGDLFEPASFDLVVSRAVLEHLYDLDAAFAAMDRVLAPGGLMLHKVDFRDHGMFTGLHPLTFLTIPERIYTLMTRHSGRPNRRLIDWYRSKLASLGYESRILVTGVVGQHGTLDRQTERTPSDLVLAEATLALLESIRPRLQPRFRALADGDLAVSGIFIIARKSLPLSDSVAA